MESILDYFVGVFVDLYHVLGGWQNILWGVGSSIVFGFGAAFLVIWLRRRQERNKDRRGGVIDV